MIWRLLIAGLVGGVCYLDRTAACQVMLHRPLVVATLMGAIFGNLVAGGQVGVVLELLYLARLPVGASVPPDDTGAAVFAGSAAAVASSSLGLDAGSFTALILLSVPFAEFGRSVDRMVRKLNGRIAQLTLDSVERGDLEGVEHGLLAGLALFAITGVVLSLAFSGAGIGAAKLLLSRFGPASRLDFSSLQPMLPLVGAASVYSCGRTERTSGLFLLSMAAMFGATLFFHWAA